MFQFSGSLRFAYGAPLVVLSIQHGGTLSFDISPLYPSVLTNCFSPFHTMGRTSRKCPTRTICQCILFLAEIVSNTLDHSRAQHAVLTEVLNVSKVFCVVGVSMGGQQVCHLSRLTRAVLKPVHSIDNQAYHWATIYPDFVERCILIFSIIQLINNLGTRHRIIVICSSARTNSQCVGYVGTLRTMSH